MTVFGVLLIAGFITLLMNRITIGILRGKINKFRLLIWISGGAMYAIGAFGQIGVYLGSSTPQAFAIGVTGFIASLIFALNYAMKLLGLDHSDEDLSKSSGVIVGKWKNNKGTVEFEVDGNKFIRPAISDHDLSDGDKVSVTNVDGKTGVITVIKSKENKDAIESAK